MLIAEMYINVSYCEMLVHFYAHKTIYQDIYFYLEDKTVNKSFRVKEAHLCIFLSPVVLCSTSN